MNEAAPHAAGGISGEDAGDALAALRYGWGDAYTIGGDLTAQDPDGLWVAIKEDYALKPVPRDLPPAGLP
jgi:hypothetical protein